MIPAFAYVRPTRLQDVVSLLADGNAQVHAGGTDLLGCLREQVLKPETLVSLSSVDGISGVRDHDGGLAIAAMTRLTDIAAHPQVQERYPVLAEAVATVGSPQLRNQGTLGGNLCQKPRCWYYRGDFDCLRKGGEKCFAVAGENQYHAIFGGADCFIVHPSDTAPALVALDAEVETLGPGGSRRLPVARLHMRPAEDPRRETVLERGELIVAIRIPPPPERLYSRYRKVRTRRAWDFAVAGCALAIAFDGEAVRHARVVLSGAAPFPWRSEAAEAAIRERRLSETVIAEAAEAAVADAEPLRKNGYKVALFKALIAEELRRAAGHPR